MTILAETSEGLHKGFDIFESYCNRWKVTINIQKTKIMINDKIKKEREAFYHVI